MTRVRVRGWLAAALVAIGAVCLVIGWRETTGDPIVVRYSVAVANWPAGVPPLRIVHLSDTHVALPDMPPARLTRIVAQANALAPDIVVLTGDYVSDKFVGRRVDTAAAIAPLACLRAHYGVFGPGQSRSLARHRACPGCIRPRGHPAAVQHRAAGGAGDDRGRR